MHACVLCVFGYFWVNEHVTRTDGHKKEQKKTKCVCQSFIDIRKAREREREKRQTAIHGRRLLKSSPQWMWNVRINWQKKKRTRERERDSEKSRTRVAATNKNERKWTNQQTKNEQSTQKICINIASPRVFCRCVCECDCVCVCYVCKMTMCGINFIFISFFLNTPLHLLLIARLIRNFLHFLFHFVHFYFCVACLLSVSTPLSIVSVKLYVRFFFSCACVCLCFAFCRSYTMSEN